MMVEPINQSTPDISIDTPTSSKDLSIVKNRTSTTCSDTQDLYIEWKKNRSIRLIKIYKTSTISEIILLYEILCNQEIGPLLIEKDFIAVIPPSAASCQLDGEIQLKFTKHFPVFAPFIVASAQGSAKKRNDSDHGEKQVKDFSPENSIYLHSPPADCSGDYINTVALLNLALLLSRWAPKRNSYSTWCPNTLEKAETSIDYNEKEVQLTVIKSVAEERKEFFAKKGITTPQPFILLTGPVSSIEKTHVIIDPDLIYECKTAVAAVNLCFKSIYSFNLNYPLGCAHIWTFIHRQFYELENTKPTVTPNYVGRFRGILNNRKRLAHHRK